jgi:uncharacterized protein with HEPN domain
MRDDRERLLDILDAIERIQQYTGIGFDAFEQDELIQVWIVHHIQIIGEAASKISETTRSIAGETRWREIIAMRNILVHDYFGVDLKRVWQTVQHNIPDLRDQIEALLKSM